MCLDMPLSNAKLNLLSWNAQSISNKPKLFEIELLLREYNIHVACIQETYLNNATKTHLDNYVIYRHDRATHGGGVAIAVKRNIKHRLLKIQNTKCIESISVDIQLGQKTLTITSAYNAQPSTHFINDLLLLTNQQNETIIMGDLNAKPSAWNCSSNNTTGVKLFDYINHSDFIMHTPTTHRITLCEMNKNVK